MENVYEVIKGSEWFDFSNYPKDHPNFNEENTMIPSKFKDESPGTVL